MLGCPTVLGLSFASNLGPSLDGLQARLGLTDAELHTLVVKQPSLLAYSWPKNVAPKLDYLQAEFALTDLELRKRVLTTPALLGYSVERRYKPRLERIRTAGLDDRRTLSTITLGEVRFAKLLS